MPYRSLTSACLVSDNMLYTDFHPADHVGVNNVGKSHAMPAYLVDTPQDEIRDIVTINVNATLQVTYAALPGMVQRCVGSWG